MKIEGKLLNLELRLPSPLKRFEVPTTTSISALRSLSYARGLP